ncbi:MAG: DUF4959 domain-containing protein [Lutibacter sp.]|jgi:hypothetical protein|nr:DUF4959 domain-containing protein [Lutibacter sp.]
MKMKNVYKTGWLLLISMMLIHCAETASVDQTPPGAVSVTGIIPTHGGAKIAYDLPNDDDILYVKGVYTIPNGTEVFRVSSVHNDTLEVDGFIDTTPQTINLSVVDESNNQSDPVAVTVAPLTSFIYLVQESMALEADLGGVKISWENIAAQTVYVYLYYHDGVSEQERILSSDKVNESFFIRGLEAIPYDFSVMVEDFNGNKTEKVFVDTVTPKFEEKIDKSTWTLVSQLSVNGNAWEGETDNFFDDIVDTQGTDSDNSYFIIWRDQNGGILNWPLDIVIDLNKQAKINRIKLWQRAYWYNGPADTPYYYQSENMRSFELYTSNDKQSWELIGSFDIGDPKDANGNISSEKLEEAAAGHDFSLDNTTEAFRYLKVSITSNYGSETYVHGSEISLYGLDNL